MRRDSNPQCRLYADSGLQPDAANRICIARIKWRKRRDFNPRMSGSPTIASFQDWCISTLPRFRKWRREWVLTPRGSCETFGLANRPNYRSGISPCNFRPTKVSVNYFVVVFYHKQPRLDLYNLHNWCRSRDSNPAFPVFKTGPLPTGLQRLGPHGQIRTDTVFVLNEAPPAKLGYEG